jgi:hypothetical protein
MDLTTKDTKEEKHELGLKTGRETTKNSEKKELLIGENV